MNSLFDKKTGTSFPESKKAQFLIFGRHIVIWRLRTGS